MFKSYICALDISSSKISAAVALLKKGKIIQIGLDTVVSKGIKNSVITDPIELSDTISRVLKNLKDRINVNIKEVHINISGQDIITKHSRAIIPLADRGNKVITSSDIQKATEQAILLGSNIDEEIIHHVPYKFVISPNNEVVNPLGLFSNRLEVELLLICGKLSVIQSINHVINQAGFDVRSISFSSLANYAAIFTDEFKKGLNVVFDFGSDVTEIMIIKDGFVKTVKILEFGGKDLTATLADSLGISWELAEDIKISYGLIGDSSAISEDKEVLIRKDHLYKPVKHRLVSEIITSKARSIIGVLKETLEKEVNLFEVNKFIASGRAVIQEGFLELAESEIGLSVELAKIANPEILPFVSVDNSLSGHKYLSYLTVLGLICMQKNTLLPKKVVLSNQAANPLLKVVSRIKELYQEYF